MSLIVLQQVMFGVTKGESHPSYSNSILCTPFFGDIHSKLNPCVLLSIGVDKAKIEHFCSEE